jgi:hypothetical protein
MPPERGIVRAIHVAHSAATQARNDPVPTNLGLWL